MPEINTRVGNVATTGRALDETGGWVDSSERFSICWVCDGRSYRFKTNASSLHLWVCSGTKEEPHDPVTWTAPARVV